VLSRQRKSHEALRTLRLMEDKGIKPNDFTYNQLIITFGKKRDLQMVEQMYQESVQKYKIKPT
jgi:pentatricopeptide repeat protein